MNQEQDEKPKSENGLPQWFTRSALIHVQNSLFPSWNKDDLWSKGETSANHSFRSKIRCCLVMVIMGAIVVGLWISFVLLMAKIYPGDLTPYEMTAEAIREYNQTTELPYWVTETVTP
jgi:hypothetical protein